MRQYFDIGDLVLVSHGKEKGIILETKPINKNIEYPSGVFWHVDEYRCKIKLLNPEEENKFRWVRAKWLSHLSKITE